MDGDILQVCVGDPDDPADGLDDLHDDPGEIPTPLVLPSPVGDAAYRPVCNGTIFKEHKGLSSVYSLLNCQPILGWAGWACGEATGGEGASGGGEL